MNLMDPQMLAAMLNGIGMQSPTQSIGAALSGGPTPPQLNPQIPVKKPTRDSRLTASVNPSLGQMINNFGTGPTGGY
jgi:hypothetical protein